VAIYSDGAAAAAAAAAAARAGQPRLVLMQRAAVGPAAVKAPQQPWNISEKTRIDSIPVNEWNIGASALLRHPHKLPSSIDLSRPQVSPRPSQKNKTGIFSLFQQEKSKVKKKKRS
jgi:hypothetical protein